MAVLSAATLIEELNKSVPPFATTKTNPGGRHRNSINFSSSYGTGAASAAASGGSAYAGEPISSVPGGIHHHLLGSADFAPEHRMYLFPDGTRVDAYQSIEGLTKFNEILMFHQDNPAEELIVEGILFFKKTHFCWF